MPAQTAFYAPERQAKTTAAAVASDWRGHTSGSLRGFFNLRLVSGLVIRDCTLHEKNGKRWVSFPARPQLEDGRQRVDQVTGKPAYSTIIEIPDRARRDAFNAVALAAVDRMRRQ
jgi:hypothetical protein